ncbi:hypothetical protein JCM10914A_43650 [Paenibacillus sp. JCM 10914]|uniref:hypothetical protein n=1 Tax=Paenibacillus sp. JCM 10914 TaxID=1236974 RepID=UPI000691AAF4|nr:hypothetical protein [Paenibacillus sp. JCM 10914]
MIMTTRRWYIFGAIVGLILAIGFITNLIQSKSSFKELVLDQMPDRPIERIYIDHQEAHYIPLEDQLVITDPATIDQIINNFSDIQLWATTSRGSGEWYRIYIGVQYGPNFSIAYTKPDIIQIWGGSGMPRKYEKTFRIINGYDNTLIDELIQQHIAEREVQREGETDGDLQ